jgi:hypothetical protein
VRFAFGIPQGQTGPQGNNGADGSPGMQGPPGPPGEVTAAQPASAIAGTSSKTNAVVQLNTPYAEPAAEELRQKLNELILALRK